MPEISHAVPLIVNRIFLADLAMIYLWVQNCSLGNLSSQGVLLPWLPPKSPRTSHSCSEPTPTSLNGLLFLDCSLPCLPLNTLFSSHCDSSFTLIKASCCRTLASLSSFPFTPVLPHFWSSACKAVMILLSNFWEPLLSCLSFNYKISLRKISSYLWQHLVFSQSRGLNANLWQKHFSLIFIGSIMALRKAGILKLAETPTWKQTLHYFSSFGVYFVSFIVQSLVPCTWQVLN